MLCIVRVGKRTHMANMLTGVSVRSHSMLCVQCDCSSVSEEVSGLLATGTGIHNTRVSPLVFACADPKEVSGLRATGIQNTSISKNCCHSTCYIFPMFFNMLFFFQHAVFFLHDFQHARFCRSIFQHAISCFQHAIFFCTNFNMLFFSTCYFCT